MEKKKEIKKYIYHNAHLMLPTSFPTLLAYAPWSLESFVERLILKNTSSPLDETT
jgi:hypothetical protein